MSERKYTSHSSEDCTDMRTNRLIKDGMGGTIRSSTDSLKQYKRSENKRKKELKSLKKQNKILYSITKKSGSHREIKKIREKDSKKTINSSSDDSDSNSSLASNIS